MLCGELDYPRAVSAENDASDDDKGVGPFCHHRGKRAVVVGVANLDDDKLDAEG
jgi:hypothetical protein